MALIVQKYGGTSVGSVERIRNVARRVAKWQPRRARPRGRAFGHGRRDQPPDRARAEPAAAARPARARRDRRDRRAGHHRPALDGAARARRQGAQLYRLAGEGADRLRVHQVAHHLHRRSGTMRKDLQEGVRCGGRRLPGRRREGQHHHARPRRLGHLRGGARRGAQGRRVPDLYRRRRRLHHRSAPGAGGAPPAHHHLRGDARDGRRRLQGAADPLGRVRRQVQGADARALQPHRPGDPGRGGGAVRHAHHIRGRPAHGDGEGSHFRRGVQPRRGQDHGARRARPARASPTRSSARSPTRTSTSTSSCRTSATTA